MSSINALPELPNEKLYESDPEHKKLRETCREFEAVMVSLLLKEGMAGAQEISASPEDEEDSGTRTFKQFAYEQMSYCVGKTGMMGLGDHIYESMKDRLQTDVKKGGRSRAPESASSAATPLGRLLE